MTLANTMTTTPRPDNQIPECDKTISSSDTIQLVSPMASPQYLAPTSNDSNNIPIVWEHIFSTLLQFPNDTIEGYYLRSWIKYQKIRNLDDFIMWNPSDFTPNSYSMGFSKDLDPDQPVDKYLNINTTKHLLKIWKFVNHTFDQGHIDEFGMSDTISEETFLKLDRRDFRLYLQSHSHDEPNQGSKLRNNSKPTPESSIDSLQLLTFKKGIKREITEYPIIKDDTYFNGFHRTVLITAKSHDCQDILDPKFRPHHKSESIELFNHKQIFMYKVFNRSLQSDMGKTIVRKYAQTLDAQQVWKEYTHHMLTSSKGKAERRRLHQYVSTTTLDGSYKGSTEQFVLHYHEQFRLLDEVSSEDEIISQPLRLIMLQNAVSKIEQLSIVETLEEYNSLHPTTISRDNLTYDIYLGLLTNACIRYDNRKKNRADNNRMAYMTNNTPYQYNQEDMQPENMMVMQSHQDLSSVVNIDTPAEQFYQVNTTNFNRNPPTSQLIPRRQNHPTNNKPNNNTRKYDGPIFLPPHIYKKLSADIIKELKEYNEKAIQRYKGRQVNQHDIISDAVEEPTNIPSTEPPEVQNDEIDLTQEINDTDDKQLDMYNFNDFIDQLPDHYKINMTKIYNISKHQASTYGSLVDRGANGGLAGADVKILSYSGRTVSVTGIDNHELSGLEIVTCASIINTNKGKVILIMNEYAYYGRGNTIHSPAQIEWFKNTCDDKSVKVGGTQLIKFLEGYITPLECRGGLMYLQLLGPPSNTELEKYPHVLLTSPHEWDPTVLDHSHSPELTYMQENPTQIIDDRIDDLGQYKHRYVNTLSLIRDPFPHFTLVYKHLQNQSTIDFDKLRPYFGWVNTDTIKRTFEKTTQWAVATTRFPMRKHIKSRFPALNITRRSEPVATDTIFADTPAIDCGVKAAQIFIGKDTLVADIYPLKSEKQFVNKLEDNIRKRGAMSKLISDYAKVEISNKVQDILRMYHIANWHSEPYHQNQNPAEGRYRTIKSWTNTIMNRTGAPANYWLLCMNYVCYLLNHISCSSLQGEVPLTKLYGTTPDISILLIYTFNQQVYYASHNQDFPSSSEEKAAVWVGFGEHVGDALTHKLLDLATNKIVFRSAVRPRDLIHPNKRLSPEVGEIGDKTPIVFIKDHKDNGGTSVNKPMPTFNPSDLLGRTFLLPKNENGEILRAKVKKQIIELATQLDQTESQKIDKINFLLDVGQGRSELILSYNQILEYLEQDNQDETHFKFRNIINHQGPLNKEDKDYKGSSYNVQVEWENGEITYEPLSIIAADDPVTCAMYAKDKNLLSLPGWKRFRNIAKHEKNFTRNVNQTKLRQARRSDQYQFGYLIPRDYNHAMELDKQNGNSKWYDATLLEMSQINEYKVFQNYGKAKFSDKSRKPINAPTGYQQIRVRLIFAVKHDGRHKARLVAGGHLTPDPVESIYSGVVSLRSLRITIFLSELNNLELWGADIGNAYLEATTDEKVFILAGPEFQELQGHILIIHKALYGLKSSGLRWAQKLHDIMIDMDYKPSKADPCVWMKPNINKKCYEYIAIYVDDLLIASQNPKEFIDTLKQKFNLKIKGDGPLEYHLGCDYTRDPDKTLVTTPKKYINKILDSYSKMFPDDKTNNIKSPLEKNDHPELDNSELLDAKGIQKYMSMVGQLQWAVSLGRYDILVHVMSMSKFRLAPRQGHLDRLKRIYYYLSKTKQYSNRIRTNPPDISILPKINNDWSRSVYGDVYEDIPTDDPKPMGSKVYTFTFFDANLYHDQVTGRSVTAILHYFNSTVIDWYSKKQPTVENATYGSEFVAAKTATEQIIDLRITLRQLGVPIHETSFMFGDNQAVITSATIPQSLLSKRHTALAYHKVREAMAAGITSLHWKCSEENWSDILSKHWEFSKTYKMIKILFDYQGKINILGKTSQDGE